jgi:hypothetical protein
VSRPGGEQPDREPPRRAALLMYQPSVGHGGGALVQRRQRVRDSGQHCEHDRRHTTIVGAAVDGRASATLPVAAQHLHRHGR